MVVLVMSDEDWVLLAETLRTDSQSSAFDPVLRERIEQALGSVEEVTDTVYDMLGTYRRNGYGCLDEVLAVAEVVGYDYEDEESDSEETEEEGA